MLDVNAKKQASSVEEEGKRARQAASAVPNLAVGRPAPLHERVKRHISEAILVGEWRPGTVLPSEAALAQSFGVAVGTVRRAMADLVAEGLLTRRRKTGTVVTGRSPHHSLRLFFQYFRLHNADGQLVRSRVRMLNVATSTASEEEAAALGMAPGGDVIRIHRIRNVDGRPVMHDRLVMSAARLPDWPQDPAALPELIYLYLLERFGIRISAVRETLTADLATEEDITLLELGGQEAVLTIEETAYDQAGAPTILARHRATTRAHAYVNEVR